MDDGDDDTGRIDAIDFYWRPGCGFCMMLRRRLAKIGLAMEQRNIWENPADAAFVRSVARGNETVPTVAVGGTTLVNPSADAVMAAVAEQAPHLVPADYEPPGPGPVSRLVDRIVGG